MHFQFPFAHSTVNGHFLSFSGPDCTDVFPVVLDAFQLAPFVLYPLIALVGYFTVPLETITPDTVVQAGEQLSLKYFVIH